MRKQDVRAPINAWRWDARKNNMPKIEQAPQILKFFKDTATKDLDGCGYADAVSLEELEADYAFISAALESGGVAPVTYEISWNELLEILDFDFLDG
jgi:hypothetical protein